MTKQVEEIAENLRIWKGGIRFYVQTPRDHQCRAFNQRLLKVSTQTQEINDQMKSLEEAMP